MTFTATTLGFLREHRTAQIETRLKAGPRWEGADLVFTTGELGYALEASSATHRFQKFLKANDLPPQRFHDLRHATASFMLAQGMPVKAIAERLGHSQISLTLNTYAHLGAELQGQAAAAMENVLRGNPG